ncbi:MAG: pSer/pThr/pTyr-binding forkhead associated (FHA) protein [Verrucomicrobiales bacterium]
MSTTIRLLHRPEKGTPVLYRLAGDRLVLGRDARAELRIDHAAISFAHCIFRWDDDSEKFVMADLGSTNGTRVNGIAIGERGVPLDDGDLILLGETIELAVIEADERTVEEREPYEPKEDGPAINPIASAVAQQMGSDR